MSARDMDDLERALQKYPEHLRPRIKAAFEAGATVAYGKFYELDAAPVFEIRWPGGAVEDLMPELGSA